MHVSYLAGLALGAAAVAAAEDGVAAGAAVGILEQNYAKAL